MSLHNVENFVGFVSTLAAVAIIRQWDCHVAKVGGKVFALIGDDGAAIGFKVDEIGFEGLTMLEGVGQAPYFAKRQWVQVKARAALDDDTLRGYLAAAHRLIAAKLTRKLRAELGIDPPAR